ncbi:MAG TPA: hypothetical protein VMS81_02200 [Methanomicrobiales archaeon]|nr:hypothetical protein [Methanomicrobiales archaeon]
MAAPPDPSPFGEYMSRVSNIIALQAIFGAILILTRYLPDRSLVLSVHGQETITLLDVNSLTVFALFLILTIAVFRQESDGSLREGDPFRRVLEGYGTPSGSTLLFRVVHAIFSVLTILVYLTAYPTVSPLTPSIHSVAGIVVLFSTVILSSSVVSAALSRLLDRTTGGLQRTFACLVYLLGLGLIFAGAILGNQNLLIAGMAFISFEILYVVIREDRRVRAVESARDG